MKIEICYASEPDLKIKQEIFLNNPTIWANCYLTWHMNSFFLALESFFQKIFCTLSDAIRNRSFRKLFFWCSIFLNFYSIQKFSGPDSLNWNSNWVNFRKYKKIKLTVLVEQVPACAFCYKVLNRQVIWSMTLKLGLLFNCLKKNFGETSSILSFYFASRKQKMYPTSSLNWASFWD